MAHSVFAYVINVDWYFNLHWLQRARAVKATGAEVHLVMGVTDCSIINRLTQEGFVCHPWNIDRRSMSPRLNLQRFIDLYRILKTIKPGLIHAVTIKPNIFIGLMSYWLKTPYVLSVTGTGIIFSGASLRARCAKPFVRLLYQLSRYNKTPRKFIFENREDRDYFVNTGLCDDREAVTILGAGVDTDTFSPTLEHSNTPVVLFAGRLLWDKGLGDLVEAGKILRRRGLDFNLQVAGIVDQATINSIDRNALETWQREGLIQWLGTVQDMPQLLANATLVVLPTFYGEGIPRILIEAAACARAIITTDIAGCREIVENGLNGLLVPPRDIMALANAIAYLLNDSELRKKMGYQGRQKVERCFSERQVIAETNAIYTELQP